ncbi:MAG: hypothetical protein IPL35_10740 [Sphingobacteriales bacterium]|nr:hypothetical protein [Sphingobacteriales bacterium]
MPSCRKKGGCPALEKAKVDEKTGIPAVSGKSRSGLLPKDGKKYFRKNGRRLKK